MGINTNSPLFQTFVAEVAHFSVAYGVIFTTSVVWGHKPAFIVSGILAAITAVKEYWYDATQEIPKQAFADNTLDFGMYSAGIGLAWIVQHFVK
jgi:hypothetical protein